MINEQIILLIAQTIWLVIFLVLLRKHKDLGMSMLMFSVVTEILNNGVWFKWWVYVLLSLFSIAKRANLNATTGDIKKLYTVEVWRYFRDERKKEMDELKIFGNRIDAEKYQESIPAYIDCFSYRQAYLYEHEVHKDVD